MSQPIATPVHSRDKGLFHTCSAAYIGTFVMALRDGTADAAIVTITPQKKN